MLQLKSNLIWNSDYYTDFKFGRWIEALRLAKKITPNDVYHETGILRGRVLEIETGLGHGITKKECEKLANLYSVDIKDMLNKATGDEDESIPSSLFN